MYHQGLVHTERKSKQGSCFYWITKAYSAYHLCDCCCKIVGNPPICNLCFAFAAWFRSVWTALSLTFTHEHWTSPPPCPIRGSLSLSVFRKKTQKVPSTLLFHPRLKKPHFCDAVNQFPCPYPRNFRCQFIFKPTMPNHFPRTAAWLKTDFGYKSVQNLWLSLNSDWTKSKLFNITTVLWFLLSNLHDMIRIVTTNKIIAILLRGKHKKSKIVFSSVWFFCIIENDFHSLLSGFAFSSLLNFKIAWHVFFVSCIVMYFRPIHSWVKSCLLFLSARTCKKFNFLFEIVLYAKAKQNVQVDLPLLPVKLNLGF